MPNTIVCKSAFPYLVSPTVTLRARWAKLLFQVQHVVGDLSMVVLEVDRSEATPSTKCGKGSDSFAQDVKLSVYATIEVAELTKQLLDWNCVWRTASRLSALGLL